jgi:hypothetical protein
MDVILPEVARRFGEDSREYLRYYSLKLKGLEEAGRVDELTRELLASAERPPGRNEAEKALNRGGALAYAARVNEAAAGRRERAAELYRQAWEAWRGRSEDGFGASRKAVAAALERLGHPVSE